MACNKFNMWVCHVSFEDGYIYANGYKDMDTNGHKYELTMSIDDLKKDLSENDFNQLVNMHQVNSHSVRILPDMRTGRLFTLEINDDNGQEIITVPEYRPFTDEEIESAKKRANEIAKLLEGDDD